MPINFTKKKTRRTSGSRKKSSKVVDDIPEYIIMDNKVFSTVVVKLTKGQTMVVEKGCLFFVKQLQGKEHEIKVKTQIGGFMNGMRRYFAGEKLWHNYFSGPDEGSIEITFGGEVAGETLALECAPGESYNLTSKAYIGGTPNISVKSSFNKRGLFTGESIFLTRVTNTSDKMGVIFVNCYGSANYVKLKEGEEMFVDNGLFLACEYKGSKPLYTITKLPGFKSFFFGGEGLLMKFKGPCELYTNNRNFKTLAHKVLSYSGRLKSYHKSRRTDPICEI